MKIEIIYTILGCFTFLCIVIGCLYLFLSDLEKNKIKTLQLMANQTNKSKKLNKKYI